MKLLLCVDGSEASFAGAELLMALGLASDTEVLVVHAVESSAPFASAQEVAEGERDVLAKISDTIQSEAEALVEREADRCLKAGWAVRTATPVGTASAAILDVVAEYQPDLVVVGATGADGSRRPLGRTARRIVKHTTGSVLVARSPSEDDAADTDEAPMPILVAYDASPASRAAVDALADIALGDRAEVTLLTVLTVSTKIYGHDIVERMSETWKAHKREAAQQLEEIEEVVRRATPHVSTRMLDGGTAATDEILDAARVVGAQLIMAGRSGKSGLQRFLLGSVSSELADYASCSVWLAADGATDDAA